MKTGIVFIGILLFIGLTSCEQGPLLSPKISRFIASEQLKDVDGKENLPKGILEYLGTHSAKKFPMPYFLVSEDEMKTIFAEQLDDRISDQLFMKISGKKHYKLFVDPSLEQTYEFLRSSYSYIDIDRTEFLASKIGDKQFILWNRNNDARRPFIANINIPEVYRTVANQKFIDRIGIKKLKQTGLSVFSHQVGFILMKNHRQAEQMITDFPDDYLSGDKKWAPIAELKNLDDHSKPFLLDIISKSDLKAYEFIDTVLINSYFRILEEMAFKNGIVFIPDALELSKDNGPTGFWILKDLKNVYPDIVTIAKQNFATDIFMETGNVAVFKLKDVHAKMDQAHNAFVHEIFDALIPAVAKQDPALTPARIAQLKIKVQARYNALVKQYWDDLKLEGKIEIKDSENLRIFIENKKIQQEWISFLPGNEKTKFYLTDYGVIETLNGKLYSLFLFNRDEKEDYKDNKKMLSIFKMDTAIMPTGLCSLSMRSFTVNEKSKPLPR